MTTSRIKEKISALVGSQFPEFIQSDFPTFVAFVEAYYRFLEQDQGASEIIQNARSYNDIDRTTDAFVEYFLNTYAKSIPVDTLLNDRFLVKKIRSLYESKGSELSFKLLFRILFDTDVTIKIPFENVLRASGGNWQQNFSIRLETITGNRNDLVNRILTHKTNGVVFNTPIVRTKNLTTLLTEVFLDPNFLSSSYNVGDLIEVFEGNTLVYSGIITPTTVSFRIDQPGTGFKVGQIFNISAGGIDTLVKVTKVSSTGGLLDLKIISYGYGYSGDQGSNILSVILDKDNNISQRSNFYNSTLAGFGSSGVVLKSDTTSPERYFDADYTDDLFYTITEIAASFNNDSFLFVQDSQTSGSISSNLSVIVFTLGALARYPGSYFDDQSFLSEFEVRLQDDQLYQPFAYQTTTDIDITLFVDVVKKLLNPAGQVLFNNRLLEQNVDLSGLDLQFNRKIFVNLHDSVKYFDSTFSEVNTFNDSASIFDTDEFYNLNKNLTDVTEVVEQKSLQTQREFNDSVVIIDIANVGILIFRSFEENRSKDYFLEEYTDLGDYVEQTGVIFSDTTTVDSNKELQETPEMSDQITQIQVFIQDYFDEEYINAGENYALTITNNITNP